MSISLAVKVLQTASIHFEQDRDEGPIHDKDFMHEKTSGVPPSRKIGYDDVCQQRALQEKL